MTDTILEMRGISKEFPGVLALENVDLRVARGEIHALMGENGAGKSTLMKVLSGVYPHGTYGGDILVDGEVRAFRDIRDSEAAGIAIIHQELALIPQLSVAENIFLGNERTRGSGVVDWGRTIGDARALLARVGLREDPTAPVGSLSLGRQQLVEIAKALSKDVRLLILDEPTSALNETDSANLLRLLREFQGNGLTSILISHKLNEITQVADSITVLRDGRSIETLRTADGEVTEERIIRGMVGRDLDHRYPERTPRIGEVRFEVRDWTVDHPTRLDRRVVDGVDLAVRGGEIVGMAGLMGAGRTEFALSLFGRSYGRYVAGTLHKDGREIRVRDVGDAIAHGIAYVPEDRKELGLILDDDIRRNMTLAALGRVSRRGVLDPGQEVLRAGELRERLRIRSRDVFQRTGDLSGGNQQKVVLGKWMFAEPDLLILDEPTRGIDVGAKYEIYQIIHRLADQGKCVLLISSELPELLGMCDRVYAMSAGRVTGVLPRGRADQESLMRLMTAARPAGAAAPTTSEA
ncbi:multiple monosaccharide ABC transporter ATP-binding protein [Marinitenerispora sediminis]|uniref:ABC transporter ATP-binding protein n=1 Tax=Marinitenerispora sediminis TaxID=1931232 RepID=A0A368T1S9_9ACTN|nr:multiple monosaccharide ABC transporter ATP-binding protein [Marinitenerispora sediminis]RCV52089.1 ABC transporter ATP-binding protein [Marinitenerispora sediminis]RCV54672.1 ABC transporter ATP-binding protein [Marinitenerispora sediminis]RCV56255.1 ABC transporter ATP-binding protein [Marinitenerispora sediminis]